MRMPRLSSSWRREGMDQHGIKTPLVSITHNPGSNTIVHAGNAASGHPGGKIVRAKHTHGVWDHCVERLDQDTVSVPARYQLESCLRVPRESSQALTLNSRASNAATNPVTILLFPYNAFTLKSDQNMGSTGAKSGAYRKSIISPTIFMPITVMAPS